MKDPTLIITLVASWLIHMIAILLASASMARQNLRPSNETIVIGLLDVPRLEEKKEKASVPKPPAKAIRSKPVPKQDSLEARWHESMAEAEQPKREKEAEPIVPSPSSSQSGGIIDKPKGGAGIGEGGVGTPFAKGDRAVGSRRGFGEGGSASDIASIQKGSGFPGPGTGERGSQEARPLQTVRAAYPPMALRMGLEADVTLKIQVDTEGKVMKAEIVKSAGMGFDEEALKAVSRFRFEPAAKDGKNISSEFTYIYRFRLEK